MDQKYPKVLNVRPAYLEVEAGKTYQWCACGMSRNQPFCDGSHENSEYSPLAWTAEESKKVFFCTCKLTVNAPLCDGTHKPLIAAVNAEADRILAERKNGESE